MRQSGEIRVQRLIGSILSVIVLVFFTIYLHFEFQSREFPAGMQDVSGSFEVLGPNGTWASAENDSYFIDFGEEVLARMTCPSIVNYNSNTFMILTYTTSLEIFDGDSLLYSYATEDLKAGKMVTRKLQFIQLPNGVHGKELTFRFVGGKDKAQVRFESIWFGDTDVMASMYLQRKSFILLMGTFLVGFGVLLMLLCILFRSGFRDMHGMLPHAMVIICAGAYILGYNDLLSFYISNDQANCLIEYGALMGVPFFAQSSILGRRKHFNDRLNQIVFAIQSVLVASLIVLQITGVRYLNRQNLIISLMLGGWAAYGTFWIILLYRREKKTPGSELYARVSEHLINHGLLILILLAMVDLGLYNLKGSYLNGINNDLRALALTFGGIIFVSTIFISYFFHCVALYHADVTQNQLEGLAYRDPLTEVSNRARCDRIMTQYQMEGKPCTLISLDLDGLKQINDTMGHQAGDRYIAGFAKLLMKVFGRYGLVGRMGGDEFLVLLDGETPDLCETLLGELEEETERANQTLEDIRYRYSAGYASTGETAGGNIQAAYMMADRRMYQMKEQHHALREVQA